MLLYATRIRNLEWGVKGGVVVLHRPHRSGSVVNRGGHFGNAVVGLSAKGVVLARANLTALIDLRQVIEEVVRAARGLGEVPAGVLFGYCDQTTKTVHLSLHFPAHLVGSGQGATIVAGLDRVVVRQR